MNTIGRTDRIDFPAMGLFNIEAKIDTGAYGCALHCHEIKEIARNGQPVLTFKVLDPDHPEYADQVFAFEKFSQKVIRSSTGVGEHRYTIGTKIVVFEKTYTVQFSLTDRSKMKFPILLGRKFLSKRFLVDVELEDQSHNLKMIKT